MKRTKFISKDEKFQYDIENEPIVLSKALIDLFLKQKNPTHLIGLYTFYYYTAKWQKTNQIKATNSYTAKALNWSERTVKTYRAILIDLKLIETIAVKNSGGHINKWYIKINFIWGSNQRAKNDPLARGQKNHRVDKLPSNALSNSSINALSTNSKNFENLDSSKNKKLNGKPSIKNNNGKPSISQRNEMYFPLAQKLSDIIRSKKDIKHNKTLLLSWSNEIRKLIETDGSTKKRIEIALDWYENNIGGQYIPVIESGYSLRNKFIKLENAIERENNNHDNKPKNGSVYKGLKKTYQYKKAEQI